jgi:hypothetical protein
LPRAARPVSPGMFRAAACPPRCNSPVTLPLRQPGLPLTARSLAGSGADTRGRPQLLAGAGTSCPPLVEANSRPRVVVSAVIPRKPFLGYLRVTLAYERLRARREGAARACWRVPPTFPYRIACRAKPPTRVSD